MLFALGLGRGEGGRTPKFDAISPADFKSAAYTNSATPPY